LYCFLKFIYVLIQPRFHKFLYRTQFELGNEIGVKLII